MSIAAVGLLLSAAIKLARALSPGWRPWVFGGLAFACVGILRWPLPWVLAALAPWAIAASWNEKA
jgi:chromate transport protein ChrA